MPACWSAVAEQRPGSHASKPGHSAFSDVAPCSNLLWVSAPLECASRERETSRWSIIRPLAWRSNEYRTGSGMVPFTRHHEVEEQSLNRVGRRRGCAEIGLNNQRVLHDLRRWAFGDLLSMVQDDEAV